MPFKSTDFAKDVAKYARLTNIQHGLPGAVRGAPAAAIIAGGVLAAQIRKRDADSGENVVEKWLGVDTKGEEVVFLGSPPTDDHTTSTESSKILAGEQQDARSQDLIDESKTSRPDAVDSGQTGKKVKS